MLIKLDRQKGKVLWAKQVSSPKQAYCSQVATGPDGAVYVTGFFAGQASFDGEDVTAQGSGTNGFVWKLSPQ